VRFVVAGVDIAGVGIAADSSVDGDEDNGEVGNDVSFDGGGITDDDGNG
jgi:hypothetical protein